MHIQEILQRLNGVKATSGGGYMASCPCKTSHKNGDKTPSLSIKEDPESGKILLHCKTGCKTGEIVAALGLSMKDLFNDRTDTRPTYLREHIYYNADGSIFGKKEIYKKPDGSKFAAWKRFDGHIFVKGLSGATAPLYHLPELLKGADPVYIPEGEKDAETLERMGFCATTSPNGAGSKWNGAAWNGALSGRDLIILTDNDEAGKHYGESVVSGVIDIAKSVRLIAARDIDGAIREKGDISDIAAARGLEEAKKLLTEAVKKADPIEKGSRVATESETKSGGKRQRLTIGALKTELEQMGIAVKLNIITVEIDIDGETPAGKPYEKDTLIAYLHSRLSGNYSGCGFDTLVNYIDFIAGENAYNPVLDYIRSKPWDKKTRVPELAQIMGIEKDSLSVALLYKWLMQGAALLENENINNPFGASGVLVLQGKQGTGKTSLLRHLAMKSVWFGEGQSIKDNDKDTVRRVVTKFISELGEVETTLRSDIEGLKNFITQPVDHYRLPYGRSDRKNCRHTNLGATCNSDRYLIDTTGNRRWWTIPIEKTMKYTEIQALDAQQLWAEILELVESCGDVQGCFRLTEEEEQQLEQRNKGSEKYIKGEAEVLDILANAADNPSTYEEREVTISEFKREYDLVLRPYSVETIGKALARQGFEAMVKRVDGKKGRYLSLPMKKFTPITAAAESGGRSRMGTHRRKAAEWVGDHIEEEL